MTNKFEVQRLEFNLSERNTRALKEFIATVPDHSAYRTEKRGEDNFLLVFWIDVNDVEPEKPTIPDAYSITLPHSAIYAKIAFNMITRMKAIDGVPFILDATNTIDLSKGFVDILVRKMKEYQVPCVITKGWVREHKALLEEVNSRYQVVIRDYEEVVQSR